MDEKVFEFYGLDFRVIVNGLALFLVIIVLVVSGIIFLFGTYLFSGPAFIATLTGSVLIGLFYFYGRHYKKLWKIIITGEVVKVYFGGKPKSRFALSELKKIHINGWFRDVPKGSYRWLRLTTEHDKFIILLGNTNLVNTSGKKGIKMFDDFFSILEAYAVKNNYLKTELKKSYHDSFAKNHYYLKNEIL